MFIAVFPKQFTNISGAVTSANSARRKLPRLSCPRQSTVSLRASPATRMNFPTNKNPSCVKNGTRPHRSPFSISNALSKVTTRLFLSTKANSTRSVLFSAPCATNLSTRTELFRSAKRRTSTQLRLWAPQLPASTNADFAPKISARNFSSSCSITTKPELRKRPLSSKL